MKESNTFYGDLRTLCPQDLKYRFLCCTGNCVFRTKQLLKDYHCIVSCRILRFDARSGRFSSSPCSMLTRSFSRCYRLQAPWTHSRAHILFKIMRRNTMQPQLCLSKRQNMHTFPSSRTPSPQHECMHLITQKPPLSASQFVNTIILLSPSLCTPSCR